MKSLRGEPVPLIVGALAFVVPLLLSLQLAWNQSIANEKAEGLRYASEVVRRGEETGAQFYRAAQVLNQDHFRPCSPQEIDLMRQIDVGSSYVQMVGRISGETLECTSLGDVKPVTVGPPTLITENGVSEWLDFKFGSLSLDRLDLLAYKGVAIVVDTGLLVDLSRDEGTGLALMVPSNARRLRLVEPKGGIRANWLNPVGRGQSVSFIDGNYVVSQVRSRNLDIQAISVIPLSHGYRHVLQFAIDFVPIGLICGVALGWAAMQISRNRLSLPGMIRVAARKRDFYVEYQPIVQMATRRPAGAEALVRWKRGGTVISPATFIQLAEDSGVISLITENVMDIVSRDLPKLLELDPKFHVSLNLSATDLKDDATIGKLIDLLRRSGASPQHLIVEATEHGLISGPDSNRVIAGIRNEGIRVAIDDFGTGYSSLACLQTLGVDLLKIDKAFVETIGTDGATSGVVLHIIEMARSMRLRTVAEGVETEAQAEFLLYRDVDYAQGWLFGKPMSIDSLCTQLRTVGGVEDEETATSPISSN
ncbi:MAG: EAL domain-containing protein [Acidobacteriaceae bacterium]